MRRTYNRDARDETVSFEANCHFKPSSNSSTFPVVSFSW
jgi:hypothetical protein